VSDNVAEDVVIRSGVPFCHVLYRTEDLHLPECAVKTAILWNTKKEYDGAYTHPVRAYTCNSAVICSP